MPRYYVVGILQQDDEWRHVNEVVSSLGWEDAALDGAAKVMGHRWSDLVKAPDAEGWNYWLLAVIELAPRLPIAFAAEPVVHAGTRKGVAWVLVGQDDAGEAWVARVHLRDEDDLETASVRVQELFPPGTPWLDVYGAVREDARDVYTVYDGNENAEQIVQTPEQRMRKRNLLT